MFNFVHSGYIVRRCIFSIIEAHMLDKLLLNMYSSVNKDFIVITCIILIPAVVLFSFLFPSCCLEFLIFSGLILSLF